MEKKIERIAVIGAGIMGPGIAQVFAGHGYNVSLNDVDETKLGNGIERVKQNLALFIKKGLATEEQSKLIFSNIMVTSDQTKAVKDADFIIEAITESIDAKKKLFEQIEIICSPHAILASNTSTIRISEMAAATRRPEKFIGTHWMLPPHIRPLVEIIPGEKTSKQTIDTTMDLIASLGKIPVQAKDMPGFIINRLQAGIFIQALALLEEGISKEAIDRAWTHHLGLRYCLMGPVEGMDSMGLDTVYLAGLYLSAVFNDPSWAPTETLKRKFESGEYGYKTGKGFYDYTGRDINQIISNRDEELINLMRARNIQIG